MQDAHPGIGHPFREIFREVDAREIARGGINFPQ
jgi:hypothetical protein